MAKTIFKAGTILLAEWINKVFGTDGHVHDGANDDGHAPKIDFANHTTGKINLETQTTGKINIATQTTGKINLETQSTGKIDLATQVSGILPQTQLPAYNNIITLSGQINNVDTDGPQEVFAGAVFLPPKQKLYLRRGAAFIRNSHVQAGAAHNGNFLLINPGASEKEVPTDLIFVKLTDSSPQRYGGYRDCANAPALIYHNATTDTMPFYVAFKINLAGNAASYVIATFEFIVAE